MVTRATIFIFLLFFLTFPALASRCSHNYLPKPYVGFLIKLRDAGYNHSAIKNTLGIDPVNWFGPLLDTHKSKQLEDIYLSFNRWRNSRGTYFYRQFELKRAELEKSGFAQNKVGLLKGDFLREFDNSIYQVEEVFEDYLFTYKKMFSELKTIKLDFISSKNRLMGESFYIVRNIHQRNQSIHLQLGSSKIEVRNIELKRLNQDVRSIKLNHKSKEIHLYPELIERPEWIGTSYELWKVEVKVYNDFD